MPTANQILSRLASQARSEARERAEAIRAHEQYLNRRYGPEYRAYRTLSGNLAIFHDDDAIIYLNDQKEILGIDDDQWWERETPPETVRVKALDKKVAAFYAAAAERKLREEEERYQTLLVSLPKSLCLNEVSGCRAGRIEWLRNAITHGAIQGNSLRKAEIICYRASVYPAKHEAMLDRVKLEIVWGALPKDMVFAAYQYIATNLPIHSKITRSATV